jgi:hypothetical protein
MDVCSVAKLFAMLKPHCTHFKNGRDFCTVSVRHCNPHHHPSPCSTAGAKRCIKVAPSSRQTLSPTAQQPAFRTRRTTSTLGRPPHPLQTSPAAISTPAQTCATAGGSTLAPELPLPTTSARLALPTCPATHRPPHPRRRHCRHCRPRPQHLRHVSGKTAHGLTPA